LVCQETGSSCAASAAATGMPDDYEDDFEAEEELLEVEIFPPVPEAVESSQRLELEGAPSSSAFPTQRASSKRGGATTALVKPPGIRRSNDVNSHTGSSEAEVGDSGHQSEVTGGRSRPSTSEQAHPERPSTTSSLDEQRVGTADSGIGRSRGSRQGRNVQQESKTVGPASTWGFAMPKPPTEESTNRPNRGSRAPSGALPLGQEVPNAQDLTEPRGELPDTQDKSGSAPSLEALAWMDAARPKTHHRSRRSRSGDENESGLVDDMSMWATQGDLSAQAIPGQDMDDPLNDEISDDEVLEPDRSSPCVPTTVTNSRASPVTTVDVQPNVLVDSPYPPPQVPPPTQPTVVQPAPPQKPRTIFKPSLRANNSRSSLQRGGRDKPLSVPDKPHELDKSTKDSLSVPSPRPASSPRVASPRTVASPRPAPSPRQAPSPLTTAGPTGTSRMDKQGSALSPPTVPVTTVPHRRSRTLSKSAASSRSPSRATRRKQKDHRNKSATATTRVNTSPVPPPGHQTARRRLVSRENSRVPVREATAEELLLREQRWDLHPTPGDTLSSRCWVPPAGPSSNRDDHDASDDPRRVKSSSARGRSAVPKLAVALVQHQPQPPDKPQSSRPHRGGDTASPPPAGRLATHRALLRPRPATAGSDWNTYAALAPLIYVVDSDARKARVHSRQRPLTGHATARGPRPLTGHGTSRPHKRTKATAAGGLPSPPGTPSAAPHITGQDWAEVDLGPDDDKQKDNCLRLLCKVTNCFAAEIPVSPADAKSATAAVLLRLPFLFTQLRVPQGERERLEQEVQRLQQDDMVSPSYTLDWNRLLSSVRHLEASRHKVSQLLRDVRERELLLEGMKAVTANDVRPRRQQILRLCQLTFLVAERVREWNRVTARSLPWLGVFHWQSQNYATKMRTDTAQLLSQLDHSRSAPIPPVGSEQATTY